MLRRFILTVILIVASWTIWAQQSTRWLEVKIGIIGVASQDILESAIKQAQQENFDGLLIRLDTPGGSLEATRHMVKAIFDSPVPIVVWVAPSGARAASAGAFITLAAPIAVMATATNIGAAHPVAASGKDIDDSHMGKKVEEDTAAFIEAIAQKRQRNIEIARSFVLTSLSLTAEEALKQKVIDFIADNYEELWKNIHGRTITLVDHREEKLNTQSVDIVEFKPSLRQQFMSVLSNPELFYLLFLAGLIGIGFELTHPGAMIPGVLGGISMILALMATSVLPISFGAMLLTLLGMALLIAEVFVPSFGILGIGGIAAFVIGSFLLVDPSNTQGLRLSFWVIGPATVVMMGVVAFIGYLVLKTDKQKILAGQEAVIDKIADVIEDFKNGEGLVRIDGEIWKACADVDFKKGDQVRVLGSVEGKPLVLRVGQLSRSEA